jgi:hypothetical protein
MSTIDPDARGRAIGARLYFLAFPACIVGVAIGPVIGLLYAAAGAPDSLAAAALMGYVLISVAAGLLIYYLPNRPGPLAIASYCVAYGGGLFFVMAAGAFASDPTIPVATALIPLVLYAVAIFLAVLQRLRTLAVRETTARGIDTTGVVQRAGVDGMIDYVQHQRLTIKFTDNHGVDRWIRVGKTGGGYSTGDRVPLRYDPERPWSKRSIIVGN